MSATTAIKATAIVEKQSRIYLYWGVLIGLLAAELLGFTLRFDAVEPLSHFTGWLPQLLRHSNSIINFATCFGFFVSIILVDAVRSDPELRRIGEKCSRSSRAFYFLASHLGLSSLLVWLTWRLFEGPSNSSSSNLLPWATAWFSVGCLSLSFWLLAFFPVNGWLRLLGLRWRLLLVSVLISIIAILVGSSMSALWTTFHNSTFWTVRGVLGLFYSDVLCSPDQYLLGTERFGVRIAPQCSGFEGIGLIWVFLAVYLWWFRKELRFPQAFWLIPLGTALSWVSNVLRIAALVMLGDAGWTEVAVGGFHSQVGWLAFNTIGISLVLVARHVRLFSKVDSLPVLEVPATSSPAATFLGPMVAIALTTMLTTIFAQNGFDQLYAARVLAALVVFWYFRADYVGILRGSWSWQPVAAGLVVYIFWTALEPVPRSSEVVTTIPNGLAKLSQFGAAGWLLARAVGSVLIIPLAEELAFRGFLTRRLISSDFESVPEGLFTWPSFLLSSLLFGLLHERWVAGCLAGMAYALVYYRRGKLIDSVLAHAVTNLSITIYVFATSEWYKWS